MARVSAGRVGIVRHRAPPQPERAHGPVEAERGRAGDLGQPARGGAAHQVHLEQPVARMHEAERRGGIGGAGGADARDAVGVEADIDRAREAGDARLLRARRQGEPQHAGDDGGHEQHDEANPRQQAAESRRNDLNAWRQGGTSGAADVSVLVQAQADAIRGRP